jgi:hypothetical protein
MAAPGVSLWADTLSGPQFSFFESPTGKSGHTYFESSRRNFLTK